MRYLTKSRFKSAIECVSKLRYYDDAEYDNAKSENEFLLALAEGGHQVGALATSLFANGVEVTSDGHEAQVAATLELLKRDEVAIFEASVMVGRLFIRIDLLHKQGDQLRMYEVKAKSFDSTGGSKILGAKGQILAEFKPYLYDVAFQRHVLREAFPTMSVESFLVMPDKSKKTSQRHLTQKLQLTKNGRKVKVTVDPILSDGNAAREILHILPVDTFLDVLVTESVGVSGEDVSFLEALDKFVAALNDPPPPHPSSECRRCEFRLTQPATNMKDGRIACWSAHFDIPPAELSSTVFDLYGLSSKRTEAIVESGRVKLSQLEQGDVELKEEPARITQSQRQWLQCIEAQGEGGDDEPFIKKAELASKLAELQYPLHFIDFETARSPLPYQPNQHPYELVLFQFSHHVVTHDGALAHTTEHLDVDSAASPSLSTLRALKQALSIDNGSVLHWWDYERTVLGEMKKQISQLSESEAPDRVELLDFIDSLVESDRLVDLGRKIVHETVFMPGTGGSSSIKRFLPALLNFSARVATKYEKPIYGASPGISSKNFINQTWVRRDANGRVLDPYDLLGERFEDADLQRADLENDDDVITNGGAAMIAYGLLQSGSLDGAGEERLKKQLLRYCELDTLAMVLAWEGLCDFAA